jgi:hypothetical protein
MTGLGQLQPFAGSQRNRKALRLAALRSHSCPTDDDLSEAPHLRRCEERREAALEHLLTMAPQSVVAHGGR